ncbi:LOW QUALITY PROTEIN: amidase family protein [Bacillus sp. JCM 19046]|nr:LOW QUALITY PROTEIN: amidase family protein [Bacillus sp. JCM 19046]
MLNSNDLSIEQIHFLYDENQLTAKQLISMYLERIALFDQAGPTLRSIIEINPDALFIAEALDQERNHYGRTGSLHGIPILLKDNIETKDFMHTSAGSIALEHHRATIDAHLVTKLREEGAIILGKTNMTEFANGMSSTMWAGYSSRGGQFETLMGDESLFVGGSSSGSGVAVAADFAPLAVGTETNGSILSPSIQNSVVGIKPTVGLISRTGIIPFSYSQDTAGPMARTVTDAAILLGVLAGVDERDAATLTTKHAKTDNYLSFLSEAGLKGARIGVYRANNQSFLESAEYDASLFEDVVSTLKTKAQSLSDHLAIPSVERDWKTDVMTHEFAHSMNHFFMGLPAHAPVHSLSELIEFNKVNEKKALKYGQDRLEKAAALTNPMTASSYIVARLDDLTFARENGLDAALQQNELDAILFPAYIGSTISAKAGYPSIAVPAGYTKSGRPFGVTFAGGAYKEGQLIKIAYGYEQATRFRKRPPVIEKEINA